MYMLMYLQGYMDFTEIASWLKLGLGQWHRLLTLIPAFWDKFFFGGGKSIIIEALFKSLLTSYYTKQAIYSY